MSSIDESGSIDWGGRRLARPGLVPPSRGKSPAANPAQSLLADLLDSCLIHPTDWGDLAAPVKEELSRLEDPARLLFQLVGAGLLTNYQASQVVGGRLDGLLLGNYRILDRLGEGGAGVVFKGQHLRFRRPVAIKTIAEGADLDESTVPRFFSEMEVIGRLRHPHIVAALDAGQAPGAGGALHYLVMEYVAGHDLNKYIRAKGPLSAEAACRLIDQVADALAEAHRQRLIHRDVKPSNILVTPDSQAKLADFGLVRHFGRRMTEPGILIGTIDYMAPEQVQDSSAVDARADIFSLGATLFWCLTGRTPFPSQGSAAEKVLRRMTQPAARLRESRPDLPAALEEVVARMLKTRPEDRPQTMRAVRTSLKPFMPAETPAQRAAGSEPEQAEPRESAKPATAGVNRVLIVDDDPIAARMSLQILDQAGLRADMVSSGTEALEAARRCPYGLVLLDVQMPGMSGQEVLRALRQAPPCAHLKIIMCSGSERADDLAQLLLAGADDYLTKPVGPVQLQTRVKAALRLKEAQDRSAVLNRQLLAINSELERNLVDRDSHLVHARNALVQALARLGQLRSSESGVRLLRLQRYCGMLAEEAARLPGFAEVIDPNYVRMLECCCVLHDIGMAGLPDYVLLKPGKLSVEERAIMENHTVIGAGILQEMAERYGHARPFLQIAIDVARHHHERFDGAGYPDGLAGTAIPPAARIVALADTYDALRTRRPYRPAFAHPAAVRILTGGSPGQFDPTLLELFQIGAARFDQIHRELPDS
jgi:response regulator RpfG family c-di-GMP phosphodiesterase